MPQTVRVSWSQFVGVRVAVRSSENQFPTEGLGPQDPRLSSPAEWERSAAIVRGTWGQYVAVCSVSNSPLTHNPFATISNKVWEVYFSKEVCSFVIIVDYVSACICIRIVVSRLYNIGNMEFPDSLAIHQSFIAPGRSSRLHLVFAQCCKSLLLSQYWHVHMQESIREYLLGIHPCTSTSALYVVRLTRTVSEMRSRWLYNYFFVGCCFQDLFKTETTQECCRLSSFFSMHSVSVHVLHSYNSKDTVTDWKKSGFILSESLHFHMTNTMSIAFHAVAGCMLTSLSVDEILLLRYVNWSNNYRGLLLVLFVQNTCSVLFAFT